MVLGASVPCVSAQTVKCPPPPGIMHMDKGTYSNQPGVTFDLASFSATLQPMGKRAPLCYAKTTIIEQGNIFVSTESLTHLFSQKLKEANSQIKDVEVEVKDNEVLIHGKVKKVLWLPFSVDGPVTTDGTNLKIDTKEIKAMGLPVKGLLDALGKHLQSLTGAESPNGVVAEGDSLIFHPYEIAHVKGHITSATVTSEGLHVRFAPVESKSKEASVATGSRGLPLVTYH